MSRPWKVPLNNKSLPSTVESAANVTFDKIPSSRQSPRWYKMSRRFKSNYWKYKTEQNKPVDCSTERAERDAVTLRGCFTPCQSNVCQFILWICFHQTFCSLTLINKKPPQDRRHVSTWWQRDITAAGFTHMHEIHTYVSHHLQNLLPERSAESAILCLLARFVEGTLMKLDFTWNQICPKTSHVDVIPSWNTLMC